jgi:hypothetical protein
LINAFDVDAVSKPVKVMVHREISGKSGNDAAKYSYYNMCEDVNSYYRCQPNNSFSF